MRPTDFFSEKTLSEYSFDKIEINISSQPFKGIALRPPDYERKIYLDPSDKNNGIAIKERKGWVAKRVLFININDVMREIAIGLSGNQRHLMKHTFSHDSNYIPCGVRTYLSDWGNSLVKIRSEAIAIVYQKIADAAALMLYQIEQSFKTTWDIQITTSFRDVECSFDTLQSPGIQLARIPEIIRAWNCRGEIELGYFKNKRFYAYTLIKASPYL